MIVTPDKNGRPQRLAMIPIEAVPMWLATIRPSKVAFAVRAKLEAYQMEVARVLAAWFLGPQEERLERMRQLDDELAAVTRTCGEVTEKTSSRPPVNPAEVAGESAANWTAKDGRG